MFFAIGFIESVKVIRNKKYVELARKIEREREGKKQNCNEKYKWKELEKSEK